MAISGLCYRNHGFNPAFPPGHGQVPIVVHNWRSEMIGSRKNGITLVFNLLVNYVCSVYDPMDRLSLTFSALADPTRRAILARLSNGPASVNDLAAPFSMSLPAVSKHLKVLERAQLISRGKEAQWRPCAIEAAPLKEADAWIEQYRQFWEQRFDRLEEYLKELQAQEKPATAKAAPKRKKRQQ